MLIKEKEIFNQTTGLIKEYQCDGYASPTFDIKDATNYSVKEIVSKIKEIDGCYRFIIHSENMDIAVVDRIRSFPVFYKETESGIEIKKKLTLKDGTLSKNALDTFYYTGFTVKNETLCQEWKQLNAGEILIHHKKLHSVIVFKYFHYQFSSDNKYSGMSEQQLIQQHDDAVNKSMQLAIDQAKDKEHIMLPLSGGEDSRLILAKLKEHGVDNVVAYTYGVKNNKEAQISQLVAKYYNVPWLFIEYDNEIWRQQKKSIQDYYLYSANMSSLPHVLDYIAVKSLADRYDLSACIFMPGHSLDFLAGSHIQKTFMAQKEITIKTLAKKIVDKHYCLWPVENKALHIELIGKELEEKIGKEILPSKQALEYFECWNWENRQAKFIVNSVRLYEYFGASWALPLWHNDLFDFWLSIDTDKRYERYLFYQYVKKNYHDLRCHIESEIKTDTKSLSHALPLPLRRQLKYLYNHYKSMKGNYNHPMGWYGLVDNDHLHKTFSYHSSLNSYIVEQYMSLIER